MARRGITASPPVGMPYGPVGTLGGAEAGGAANGAPNGAAKGGAGRPTPGDFGDMGDFGLRLMLEMGSELSPNSETLSSSRSLKSLSSPTVPTAQRFRCY